MSNVQCPMLGRRRALISSVYLSSLLLPVVRQHWKLGIVRWSFHVDRFREPRLRLAGKGVAAYGAVQAGGCVLKIELGVDLIRLRLRERGLGIADLQQRRRARHQCDLHQSA